MPKTHAAVQVTLPGQGETIDILGAAMSVLCDGRNLPLMVGEYVVPPGSGVPPHVHDGDDELFVVLDGELTVSGPDGEARAGIGTCVQLPRRIPHAFRNDGSLPARLIVMALPGYQVLEMFRHFDRTTRQQSGVTPPEIATIAGQYGVRFV